MHLSKIRNLSSILIIIFFIFNVFYLKSYTLIERAENAIYDIRLNLTMPNTIDKRIVIVDIDEKSLIEQGRWPWGRDKIAKLVNTLFDQHHIKTLGFDMVFSESEENSGIKVLNQISQAYVSSDPTFKAAIDRVRSDLDTDQMLANSFKGRPVVLGYYFRPAGMPNSGVLPMPSFKSEVFNKLSIDIAKAGSFGGNIALLQSNAMTAGHFNTEPDSDGSFRRINLLEDYHGSQYPSFALAVAQVSLGQPKISPALIDNRHGAMAHINMGAIKIPIDNKVRTLIPYLGAQGSFRYVSATDVLNGKVKAGILNNAIVLVGTSAPGLMDLATTPVQNVYPGVEIQANVIAGILDSRIVSNQFYRPDVEALTLILIGLLLTFTLPKLGPIAATAFFVATTIILAVVNVMVWNLGFIVPLASVLIMSFLLFLINMTYGFLIEVKDKKLLSSFFGRYVPPEIVAELSHEKSEINMEGEVREMTVMFTDVRNFTKISENLSPSSLIAMMNDYLTPMTKVIHKNRGTIDKYIGDAIMAFWGAPTTDAEHARHALESAFDMLDTLVLLQQEFQARGWPIIHIGIGISSGKITVGNMGSVFRTSYTVMGDAVNLASRLESLTKEYGVPIIVSEYTKSLIPTMHFRELDLVQVKGSEKAVRLYEPMQSLTSNERRELEVYQVALASYRKREWTCAELLFNQLIILSPSRKIYRIYLQRTLNFIASPAHEDWNAIHYFNEK